ncbi:MAG: winged helix-turn-helix transcriptional regulator [Euryarchaeota archaeon]|jgi:predicted transcriptional regulator|nr:winged helix-turn-helix transcriptional regulator [Euryarchaeota archaeon]MBT6254537.1 winged helix-turn-helix transcriptional regulator [Euryarchaeota archaeon]
MNGSWVVRFLFIAAISSLVFGLSGDNQSISTNVPNDEGAAFSPEGFDEATESTSGNDFEPKYSEDAEQGSNGSEPNYFIGLGGGILAALFLGSGVFEVLKIAVLMALFTPLISKKSRNDELNRGRILGFIEGNAGIHFSALRDGLQLANGVTAYHLQMLETQNEIISWRDGKLRRYAAAHLSVEQRAAVAHPVIGTRLAILETLSRAGQLGLSNAQIAEQLQLSRQLLSYHIKSLSDESFIEKVLPKRRSPWALTTNGQEILVQRNTA